MNEPINDTILPPLADSRFELTAEERALLAKDRYEVKERQALARLYDPFAKAFYEHTAQGFAKHYSPLTYA